MTDDLIRRQDAIDALGEEPLVWSMNDEYALGNRNQWHDDIHALKAVPSAQTERKHGKWKQGYCSECGYNWGKDAPIASVPNFCPNCGARMDESKDDD